MATIPKIVYIDDNAEILYDSENDLKKIIVIKPNPRYSREKSIINAGANNFEIESAKDFHLALTAAIKIAEEFDREYAKIINRVDIKDVHIV